jgi:hypothetical protein
MSVIVEGTTEEDFPMYIGRYSIETSEIRELPIEDFNAVSDEARLVVNEDVIVYMYCTHGENGLMMKITLFDMASGTKELLYETAVKNVFGYAKKLDSQQLIFMLYQEDKESSETRQIILNYNMATKTIREIYKTEPMNWTDQTSSTKNIWAIDTYEEKLYLLSHQLINGKMKTFLDVLNSDGKPLNAQELHALGIYDSRQDVANHIVVSKDYLFIHYDQFAKEEGNTNPPFAILAKTAGSYQLINMGDIYPSNFCGGRDSSAEHLYFSISPPQEGADEDKTKRQVFAFDMTERSVTIVDLPLSDVENFTGDSAGNLIVYTRGDSDMSNWYFIPGTAMNGV